MKSFVCNKAGDLGEVFAKEYCEANNIAFKKATKSEDLRLGIDAYINNLPTDIKNTKDIYFLQLSDDGEFNTRHPFKETTKASHYFFVNVSEDHKEFIEFIAIKEKLLKKFFKDEEALENFFKFLKSLDDQTYHKFGNNFSEACLKIKNIILPYLKENVTLSYEEPKNSTTSFKLMEKKENKITKKNIFDAKALIKKNLDQIKNSSAEEKKEANDKENVIFIKI